MKKYQYAGAIKPGARKPDFTKKKRSYERDGNPIRYTGPAELPPKRKRRKPSRPSGPPISKVAGYTGNMRKATPQDIIKSIRDKMQKGGTMKSVPAGKKFNGLRSLPTGVRNKMGYARYGGMKMVKGGSLRRSMKHK